MAGSHTGPGYNVPGVQNQMGQQGAFQYHADNQYVERVAPSANDSILNQLFNVISSNKKLQGELKQINELFKGKLKEVKELKEEKQKLEIKFVEASQNYENAKVVVLTYKTRNIRLESATEERTLELEVFFIIFICDNYIIIYDLCTLYHTHLVSLTCHYNN